MSIFVFRTICLLLALRIAFIQFHKYLANNDKPILSYRKFHEDPADDKYPTYTVCFSEKDFLQKTNGGHLFQESYLRNVHNISSIEYLQYLRGYEKHGDILQRTIMDNISIVDASKGSKQLLNTYRMTTTDGLDTGYVECNSEKSKDIAIDKNTIQLSECPFYRSYQDSERICLSRKDLSKEHRHQSYSHEELRLTKDVSLRIHVYIHYPYQGMRTFFKMFSTKKMFYSHINTNLNKVTFILGGVNIVKKRVGGKQRCKLDNLDDLRIFQKVAKVFGCLPEYWKGFQSEKTFYEPCKTSLQLQNVWEMIHKTDYPSNIDVLNSMAQPCLDMSFGMSIKRGDIRKEAKDRGENYTRQMFIDEPFQIHFQYPEESYLQTLNVHDYDLNLLWANVGGYIGIILGYNLAQFPQIIGLLYGSWKNGDLVLTNNLM